MQQLLTLAWGHYRDSARQAGFHCKLQQQRLRLQNAKNTMTFKAITTFNQLQLKPLVIMACPPPLLSGLAKKLVMSGDPREHQWLHQRLSLAVVKRTTASTLACVQVWSNIICSLFFSCFWCTDQYRCLPLAPISIYSHCLVNPPSFYKFHCSHYCAVFLCALVEYLANYTTHNETAVWCYAPHCLI